MGTLREDIYSLLEADAQLDTGTELGTFLHKTTTAPYGVYFLAPPETPDFPILTYYFSAQEGKRPRSLFLNFTAFSKDFLFESILNRVHILLNNQIVTPSDFTHLMMKFDWASSEMFDDDYKIYKLINRYLLKAWKT